MVEKFPCVKKGTGCSVAQNEFPLPLFLKGGKFIFAHPVVGEIDRGKTGEIRGIEHPQSNAAAGEQARVAATSQSAERSWIRSPALTQLEPLR